MRPLIAACTCCILHRPTMHAYRGQQAVFAFNGITYVDVNALHGISLAIIDLHQVNFIHLAVTNYCPTRSSAL